LKRSVISRVRESVCSFRRRPLTIRITRSLKNKEKRTNIYV
jgi:hypothetical protein